MSQSLRRSLFSSVRTLLLSSLILSPATAETKTKPIDSVLALAKTLCNSTTSIPNQLQHHRFSTNDIIVRGSNIGTELNFTSNNSLIKLEVIDISGRPRTVTMTSSIIDNNATLPTTRFTLDDKCELLLARRITYQDNTALYIEALDQSLEPLPEKEWLNPPLPKNTGKQSGLRVALIDSGVNYTLPSIGDALALNEAGEFIGFDFWDNDNTPYDANPARSDFFVQRHGTRTASILIREAPDIALVPYRYPRPDMTRMKQLIEHAAHNSVRIIGMPLGSNRYEEWTTFSDAAANHPDILFIVSAGNNGRDIDIRSVYPASLEHANLVVVTSADDYAQPAERTNYGKLSVDYMLPAENIHATDYNGEQIKVSGSSYAVSRLTAMAARLLAKNPEMNIEQLKSDIAYFSVKANTGQYVSTGYIGDPMADTAAAVTDISMVKEQVHRLSPQPTDAKLQINLIALDSRWTTQRIKTAVNGLNSILKQCEIHVAANQIVRIDNAGYLANLSPGSAMTLQRLLKDQITAERPTVFFADDSDMQIKFEAQAFGTANTRNRPWMRNTVWISENTKTSGMTLAHELYHVLTNSGKHNNLEGNLMQDRTVEANITLTQEQCQAAVVTATQNGLLVRH